MMRDSEIQSLTSQRNLEIKHLECKTRIELEELRHKHIMEEIEAMKKAKITSFVRQVKE